MLYLAVGALGAPVFTDGSGGVEVIQGATGGYLIGFVFAAGLVGWMAEHRQDRTFATMFTAFILGSAVIYAFGVVGLMISADMSLAQAVELGVIPFLLGDLIKAAAAGILLPGAWKLLGDD
jgi:biotin transport system substrate-specific component